MKKLFHCTCVALLCFVYSPGHAQAFEKKDILLSLGLGVIDDVYITGNGEGLSPVGHYNASPVRPQFMFKAEFAVHKYWGVGFISSVDGRMNMFNSNISSHYSELNTQLGLLVNYHVYQLIADKLNRPAKMHADKIDVYTGFTIGAVMYASHIDGFPSQSPTFDAFMGLHMGIRYYVTPRLSVYSEFGIGQSFFNTGVSFKLGWGKKQPAVPKKF